MTNKINELLNIPVKGELSELFVHVSSRRRLSVFGMNFAHKLHVLSRIKAPVFYVVPDALEARKVTEGLEAYGIKAVRFPEKEDSLFFKRSSSEGVFGRIKVLYEILEREPQIIVATPEAVMAYTPEREKFASFTSVLEEGGSIGLSDLITRLVSLGYTRADYADSKGTFASRGDIVDVFSPSEDKPYRIEFFGDEIERIHYFEEKENIQKLVLLPVTDLLFTEEERKEIVKRLYSYNQKGLSPDAKARLGEIISDAVLSLDAGSADSRLNWVIPFATDYLGTVLDYLPEETVCVYDECRLLEDRTERLYKEQANRVAGLLESGEVTSLHVNCLRKREGLYKNDEGVVAFQQITTMNPIFEPTAIFSYRCTPIIKYHLDRSTLVSDLKNWKSTGYTVALCARDEESAKAVAEELVESGAEVVCSNDISEGSAVVVPCGIKNGLVFHSAKIVLIGTDELLRKKSKTVKLRKKDVFTIPAVGDYVVHDRHGIGVFKGIERLKTDIERDCVCVEYTDGVVYVPIDQMGMLARYSGGAETPKLSKIGGKEFTKLKERVKSSVKAMAFDLLELYARREESNGIKYPEDSPFQTEFEERFPYTPTEDQITAINEIKSDMHKGKVMDRLLCGDVGYGKTEVALRAVFKTVLEGYQVAILAPTTILARQHYDTVLKRFEGYGLNIGCLSRFTQESEKKAVLEALRSGKMNIVCGTHRLLSNDVNYARLGLLVLDEEQRFGVEDKEKLKLLRNDVNVLSLSATPIPRTLHMSLTGIRDISVLETPPENRLPVETYVTEFTDGLLQDAVKRELMRGGQAFVLYNRVESIDKFASRVQELIPEARVIYAHAKLSAADLEKRMNVFYSHDADVLVSTTIIENGIDLPNANTLIVYEADKLGLSQLYQLRGRVGRSDRLAYAYFTYPEGRVLTENAGKRLQSVMDYSELGSGFKIAMRDLEIRGAGNVLGREQHGHIDKVGYDLYCKLLEESIAEIKGEKVRNRNVDVKISVNAIIPESIVLSERERMRLYRRIASLESRDEIKELSSEVLDVYGTLPEEIENLMKISYISNLSAKINVAEVVINHKGTGIRFRGSSSFKEENVLYAVSEFGDGCIVQASPPSVVFRTQKCKMQEKIEAVTSFLELASQNIQ